MKDLHRFDDLFSEFGPIRLRRFFGGEGIAAGDVMIGMVFGDIVYFKTDEETRAAFVAEKCKPFTFVRRSTGNTMVTSWYALPDRLYDDPDELAVWARAALNAMRHSAAGPKTRKVSAKATNTETKAAAMTTSVKAGKSTDASKQIDGRIKELGDWRGKTLARVRGIIKEADPEVVETWKWRDVPVWEHDGIICTGETYKAVVKLTFAKGASLDDPARLFNSSLDGNMRRAINIREGEAINESALKALIRAAIDLNRSKSKKMARAAKPAKKTAAKKKKR